MDDIPLLLGVLPAIGAVHPLLDDSGDEDDDELKEENIHLSSRVGTQWVWFQPTKQGNLAPVHRGY
jgi:hypothetical protein